MAQEMSNKTALEITSAPNIDDESIGIGRGISDDIIKEQEEKDRNGPAENKE